MPVSEYNRYFGGKKNSAAKAKRRMRQHYGEKKGEQVFYATKNKNRSQQQRGDREQMIEAFRRHGKRRKGRGSR